MTEPRDVRVRLADMVENLRLAQEFCARLSSPDDLASDRMSRYAVVQALLIVGEAAKHVPSEVRALAPEVPWAAIAGMRDRLAHGYFEVDLETVWHSATADAPAAESRIRALLARLDAEAAQAKRE